VSTIVKSREIISYLLDIMKIYTSYIAYTIVVSAVFFSIVSCSTSSENVFSETVKVALRDVGHHLLLNNNDSTSVVSPVIALDTYKFQLTFENTLSIHPDSLVNQIKYSFQKAELSQYYLVEVLQCADNEVAYSYEMDENIEKGIIPCSGRELKNDCYLVTVHFTKIPETNSGDSKIFYLLGLAILMFLVFLVYKRNLKSNFKAIDHNFSDLGRYKFYPDQNKLIKEAIEISLSKKECELLALFVAEPNQIIKRDVLTKKVWEDNGVIVGRSLDTYISKLRKKLQDDDSIKLTNVHGVGYKLELNYNK
jgi:hypothetical protein